jgi:hypothetical protein
LRGRFSLGPAQREDGPQLGIRRRGSGRAAIRRQEEPVMGKGLKILLDIEKALTSTEMESVSRAAA